MDFKLIDAVISSYIFFYLFYGNMWRKKLWGTKLWWCAGVIDTEYSWGWQLHCFRDWCQCKSVYLFHRFTLTPLTKVAASRRDITIKVPTPRVLCIYDPSTPPQLCTSQFFFSTYCREIKKNRWWDLNIYQLKIHEIYCLSLLNLMMAPE